MPVLLWNVKTNSFAYRFLTVFLRAALLAAIFTSGWLVYSKLPHESPLDPAAANADATLQIVLRQPTTSGTEPLDIAVELYPIDIVAVRHEYFTEPRPGKRFEDFFSERMKGRTRVSAKLDQQGQASVVVPAGSWWLHAQLPGEENLEWRLQLSVTGAKQTVELTPQNIYTRTRSF